MSSPNLQEIMEVLRQMQQSQDEKFRVLADENKEIKGKFTEFSEQFAYETNYMASPKFDGTSKHVITFCNQVRSMLSVGS